MNKKLKILILRFSSIGDIVLTTPVVRCLKEQTNCELHYCTKPGFKRILESNPYIDKVLTLENSIFELAKQIKSEKYDYIIDLHHNLKTSIIKTINFNTTSFSFHKLNLKKYLLVNFKINKMPNIHIVDRYMETVASLNVANDNKGLDYFIPKSDEIEMDWLPASHQNGYYAFSIGGQHNTKKLPAEKIIALCHKINAPIVLLGGKEDKDEADKIEAFFAKNTSSNFSENTIYEQLQNKTSIFNACGKFNLNQSADLLQKSIAVFTHDTGLMHIASALKKEIHSIWGNTVPEFGMYPYQTKFFIYENKTLSCRPCSKIGYKKCPKGHFKCMNDIKFSIHLNNDIPKLP